LALLPLASLASRFCEVDDGRAVHHRGRDVDPLRRLDQPLQGVEGDAGPLGVSGGKRRHHRPSERPRKLKTMGGDAPARRGARKGGEGVGKWQRARQRRRAGVIAPLIPRGFCGFRAARLRLLAFQNRCLRPLGHSSRPFALPKAAPHVNAAGVSCYAACVIRTDGRALTEHRPVEIVVGFQRNAEGSALYRAGGTVVLCTVSVDASVPAWMAGKGKGWLTAEYQMHPRSSPQRREPRDGRGKAPSGRTQEIQRLIGRALRSAIDLDALGERTLAVDCDVLEADGGTRTASITGSFIALALSLDRLRRNGTFGGPVLRDQVAAISVGHLEQGLALDLAYVEDAAARVDLNLVATASGAIVEVQGTAEGEAVPRAEIDAMVDLGLAGTASLARVQRDVLTRAGVELGLLFQPGRST